MDNHMILVLMGLAIVVLLFIIVRKKENKRLNGILLLLYFLSVLLVTLVFRDSYPESRFVYDPFGKYFSIWNSICQRIPRFGPFAIVGGLIANESTVTEIAMNILLFIPLGYLLPIQTEYFQRWWKVMMIGLSFSAFIELMQLVTCKGYFDVTDIINNVIGTVIGYWVWLRWMHNQ